MLISPNTDDIRNYMEMKLERAMDKELRADIDRVILEKVSDT